MGHCQSPSQLYLEIQHAITFFGAISHIWQNGFLNIGIMEMVIIFRKFSELVVSRTQNPPKWPRNSLVYPYDKFWSNNWLWLWSCWFFLSGCVFKRHFSFIYMCFEEEKKWKKKLWLKLFCPCGSRNKLIVHSCSLPKERGSQTNLKESQTFNEKTQSLNLL